MGEELRVLNARLFARSKDIEDRARQSYRTAQRADAYWCLVDLSKSAAFRLRAGDERAFVRAKSFFGTLHLLSREYAGVHIFKEMGDGALLRVLDLRDALEVLVVLDALTQYWDAETSQDASYPSLHFKAAISHGSCVGVDGDYFGAPIDRVSRIINAQQGRDAELCIVDDEVRRRDEQRLRLELPFISFGSSRQLDAALLKPGEHSVRTSSVLINRGAALAFTDYFAPLRSEVIFRGTA